MECREIVLTGHAFRRMLDRTVHVEEIETVVRSGEVIEDYPDDTPLPSCLLLGMVRGEPLHVVVGRDEAAGRCVIISLYRAEPLRWDPDFRQRRPR